MDWGLHTYRVTMINGFSTKTLIIVADNKEQAARRAKAELPGWTAFKMELA